MENNEFKIDPSLLLDGTEKVGDTIWTIEDGYCTIMKNDSIKYPLRIGNSSYTKCGRLYDTHKYPSAFKRNPFEKQYPKLMEVSDDGVNWFEQTIRFFDEGKYWVCDYLPKEDDYARIDSYKYAREIQPKPVEFTEEQIDFLKRNGVDVEQLNIKK